MNQFSDMTAKEIERYTGAGLKEARPKAQAPPTNGHIALEAGTPVDWKNAFGVAKNQGSCGSCWAFAAVGTLESNYYIKHGSRLLLSEQQLVDCTRNSYGCDGGWIESAL